MCVDSVVAPGASSSLSPVILRLQINSLLCLPQLNEEGRSGSALLCIQGACGKRTSPVFITHCEQTGLVS